MPHRLLNLATALSLLLLVATVVVWVRSYHVADYASCGHERDTNSGKVPRTWFVHHWELLLSAAGDGWLYARVDACQAEIRDNPKRGRMPDGFWVNCGHEQPNTDMGSYLPGQWWHGFDLWWERDAPSEFGNQDFRVISGWSVWVGAPAWFIAPLLAILPLMKLRMIAKRAGRSRAGYCAICGYDLTANLSGVCPECGSKVPA